jgi:ankyrin repeat protein
LSQYYVDLSYKDNDGNTPAHLAAKNDKLNCLKFLVQYGLPLEKLLNNLGRNVAHVCCINGSIKSLHWLLENNKNLDTLDS